jgi:uncharacterized protein YjgD (DUF1641 family)
MNDTQANTAPVGALGPAGADDATSEILARMDAMSAQLAVMSEQVAAADAARQRWTELLETRLEPLATQLDSASDLAAELTTLSSAGMARLTEALQVADDKGYFAFARGSAAIADRIVTSYDESDVTALGDNIVTILDATKELTQPELMGLMHRAARTLQDAEAHPTEPPSALALMRSLRDPQTRRGLGRLMAMLHAIGEENHAHPESGALALAHRRPDTTRPDPASPGLSAR